jgi:hypothetical protein
MDDRDRLIADALRAGRTQASVARDLNISGPAVSARVRRSPALMRLRPRPKSKQVLTEYRATLYQLEVGARNLARRLHRAVQIVDDELLELEIDEALS